MTLEEIYFVGQTIAAAAIIGSLLALIAQNHAAQKMVRDAAVRSQVEGLQNISRALFETPGMADVWFRGIGGLDHLSEEFQRFYENNLAQHAVQDIYGFKDPSIAPLPEGEKLT